MTKKEKPMFEAGEPYIIMDGNKWFMYYGHPRLSPIKIDVTAAVLLGLRMGTGQFEHIESIPVSM